MTTGSWYRRHVWTYKGNREYTKGGYQLAKERFTEDDLDVDCSDRHYVITGCNQGIGLEIAKEIAKRGGVLHMVCRNSDAMKEARADIITTTGNDKIHMHTLDLSRPRDVSKWARNFASEHDKVHVLINNAGCMIHQKKIDQDGIEYNFAVNTLAVHIITTALIPVLQKNEDARVITVSSAGMLMVRLDPIDLMHENMNPFIGNLVYSQHKRQQVAMSLWYAQRFDGIHFSSMHPGWADTTAVRTSIPIFYEQNKSILRTAAEGADTVVWLAISKAAVKHPSGFFFQDREPTPTHLPLAWTKSSIEEENHLMQKLDLLAQKVSDDDTKKDLSGSSLDEITVVNSHNTSNGIHAVNGINGINGINGLAHHVQTDAISTVSESKSAEKDVKSETEELKEPAENEDEVDKEIVSVYNNEGTESINADVGADEDKDTDEITGSEEVEVIDEGEDVDAGENEGADEVADDGESAGIHDDDGEIEIITDDINNDTVENNEETKEDNEEDKSAIISPTPSEQVSEKEDAVSETEGKSVSPDVEATDEEQNSTAATPEATPDSTSQVITPEPTSQVATPELTPQKTTPEPKSETATPEPTSQVATPEPESQVASPEPELQSTTAELDETEEVSTPEPTSQRVTPEADPSTPEPTSKESTPEPGTVENDVIQEPDEEVNGEIASQHNSEVATSEPDDAEIVSTEEPKSEAGSPEPSLDNVTPEPDAETEDTPELKSEEATPEPIAEEAQSQSESEIATPEPDAQSDTTSQASVSVPDIPIIVNGTEETTSQDGEKSSVSPTPSETVHNSAVKVVEHLIDITAQKAEGSIS